MLLGHRLLVGGVFLGVELVVVALDEDRAGASRPAMPGEDGRRVVDRALERVGLARLRASSRMTAPTPAAAAAS